MELIQQQQQSLQLALSPQMKLSLELLQSSMTELISKLQDAFETNPFLEAQFFDGQVQSGQNKNEKNWSLDRAEPQTLTDVLSAQLFELNLSPLELELSNFIIKNLDENGRIQDLSIEEIANLKQISPKEVMACIKKLQLLEPVGCVTFSIEESLLVQAKINFPHENILHKLIEQHLEHLAENQLNFIYSELNISSQQLDDALKLLRTLHIHPGLQIDAKTLPVVIPDIIIEESEDNKGFIPKYNEQNGFSVYLSEKYLDFKPNNKEQKRYYTNQLNTARALLKALELRKKTLLRIAYKIIDVQKQFFIEGVNGLRPLSIAAVAEKLKLHISTISRAVKNKYLSCHHGVYELSFFFQQGFQTIKQSQSVSVDKIKHYLSLQVKQENKKTPIADEELAVFLQKKFEINISRRTVAKYREQLNIPGSFERKRKRIS